MYLDITYDLLITSFFIRFDAESESDVEMTAATQLRGNVSPLTPPPRLVTAVDDDEAEIQLPPLPPPPGEQVTILAFFRLIKH